MRPDRSGSKSNGVTEGLAARGRSEATRCCSSRSSAAGLACLAFGLIGMSMGAGRGGASSPSAAPSVVESAAPGEGPGSDVAGERDGKATPCDAAGGQPRRRGSMAVSGVAAGPRPAASPLGAGGETPRILTADCAQEVASRHRRRVAEHPGTRGGARRAGSEAGHEERLVRLGTALPGAVGAVRVVKEANGRVPRASCGRAVGRLPCRRRGRGRLGRQRV